MGENAANHDPFVKKKRPGIIMPLIYVNFCTCVATETHRYPNGELSQAFTVRRLWILPRLGLDIRRRCFQRRCRLRCCVAISGNRAGIEAFEDAGGVTLVTNSGFDVFGHDGLQD